MNFCMHMRGKVNVKIFDMKLEKFFLVLGKDYLAYVSFHDEFSNKNLLFANQLTSTHHSKTPDGKRKTSVISLCYSSHLLF